MISSSAVAFGAVAPDDIKNQRAVAIQGSTLKTIKDLFKMRMADNDELDNAMYRASMKAMNGSVIGTTIGMAGYFGLNKFSPWYRKLPTPLKAFSVAVPVIGFMMVYGENELLRIEHEQHAAFNETRLNQFRKLEAEEAASHKQ